MFKLKNIQKTFSFYNYLLFIFRIIPKCILFVLIFLSVYSSLFSQDLLNIKSSALVTIKDSALLQVNGSVSVEATATVNQTGPGGVTIRGNLTNRGTISPRSNWYLTGNLLNYGTFNALADSLVLVLNGNTTQKIYNASAPALSLYSLTIDKSAGSVQLDTGSNSNLSIYNTLIFSATNQSVVDSRTNNHYVQVGTNTTTGQITRNTLGHVDGRLYMYVGPGISTVVFPVGSDVITGYRPVTIVTTAGTTGAAGLVSAQAFNTDHPEIASTNALLTTNVQKYWSVQVPAGSSFSLGDRTYSAKTEFLNPGDIRGGADPNTFFHFFRTPAYPAALVSWTKLATPVPVRTATSVTSSGLSLFGDFEIAEPKPPVYFYSRINGNWDDPNTWSREGYEGAVATTFPAAAGDSVRIGNGKRVTINSTTGKVGNVYVERFNNLPGELYVHGSTTYLDCNNFTIEDSCTFAFQHKDGIKKIGFGGAVQVTGAHNWGYCRLIANGDATAQDIVPSGMPDTVLTFIIDNTFIPLPGNSSVTIHDASDKSSVVLDSFVVNHGIVSLTNNKNNIRLFGHFDINNSSTFKDFGNTFTFAGTRDHILKLSNIAGVQFNKLVMEGGNLMVADTNATGDTANVIINENLIFSAASIINTRAYDRKVIIDQNAVVTRTAAGYVDGKLQKPVNPASAATNYTFEIGNGTDYTPVTLNFPGGSGGAAGHLVAINYTPLPNVADNNRFTGHRMDPVRAVQRYWKIDSASTGSAWNSWSVGSRTMNATFQMPSTDISAMDTGRAVIRHRNNINLTSWEERRNYTGLKELIWNYPAAGVVTVNLRTSGSPAVTLWGSVGEFYIGEHSSRIFYSYNGGGNWDANTSWAFDKAGTMPCPAGQFPNMDWNLANEIEIRDSVIIDGGDVVTLNTQPEMSYLNVQETGSLVINNGSYASQSHMGTSNFSINDNALLNIKSNLGIETDTSISILRFANTSFAPTANYEFSGSVQQRLGSAFPSTINNLTISNTGVGANGIVSLKQNDLLVNGNVNISSATTSLRPFDGTTNLRLAGNMTVTGTFDGCIDASGATVASAFTFQGSGASNQTVSGSGAFNAYNLVMNRGAGTGVSVLDMTANICNQMDMQEAANANPQILSLGTQGNININNSNANAITDYSGTGTLRYIRTSTTSGSLTRNVAAGASYVFPVGSFESGADHWAPMTYTAGATGSAGAISVRTSPGTSTIYTGGHSYLPNGRVTDYLKRYWAVSGVTTTIDGMLKFEYNAADVSGSEAAITGIGRWSQPRETAGGMWTNVTGGNIDRTNNYFETAAGFSASSFAGDWTMANVDAFLRIFFSRQTGNWTSDQSWTTSSTHSGPIVGTGQYPNDPKDSVVIGANHIITLDQATVNISGVLVGTSSTNFGTLDCGPNIITGNSFQINDKSTLRIGSPQGITASAPAGNIQTTVRDFSPAGSFATFEYNGTTNQDDGNGLPANVRSLIINNQGLAGYDTVKISKNINIQNDLTINQGRLDAQNFTARGSGSGTFAIAPNATLRLSDANNLSNAVSNYGSYSIDPNSYIEFYGGNGSGGNQIISSIPAGMSSLGLGHVMVSCQGTKVVSAPLVVRGNLIVTRQATLQNDAGVNSLEVRLNVINSAGIVNNGIINIGQ